VGREEHENLRALHDAVDQRRATERAARRVIGAIMFNALIISLLGLTILIFRPAVYRNLRWLWMFAGVTVIVLLGATIVGHARPVHPELKIAMDMSIQMKVPSGAICTLALSFNNEGPLGTFFRYICDNGTYIARYDDLFDGKENKIDLTGVTVSNNGIELQDREFISAIREGREPNSSFAQILPCMRTLDQIEKSLL